MKVIETGIPGLCIIEPKVWKDARGYFFESFSKRDFEEAVGKVNFVQDNQSCSTKGVIRGLHFQKPPYSQAKLVRCVVGKVRDVALDLRKNSPTFGKYLAVELSEENNLQFFIPKGFAHGFEVLSDIAVFQYKCDEYYHPEVDGGINAFDNELEIEWLTPSEIAIVSEKDKNLPKLGQFESPF